MKPYEIIAKEFTNKDLLILLELRTISEKLENKALHEHE